MVKRYEIVVTGRWGKWCKAEDVTALEDENVQLRRIIDKMAAGTDPLAEQLREKITTLEAELAEANKRLRLYEAAMVTGGAIDHGKIFSALCAKDAELAELRGRLVAILTATATWLRQATALFRMSPQCEAAMNDKANMMDEAAAKGEV